MALLDNWPVGEKSSAVDVHVARLAAALLRSERTLTARLARILEREGSSVDEWHVLCLLAEGGRHTMTELAAAATVPGPSLTRLVDRLVADNLVYRRVDEDDRRRIRVHMTERGHDLRRRLSARIERDAHTVLAGATVADAEQIIELLEQLG
ncbi:MAG TPA: MarR family transcriptional regulator [Solirubrobacteraceae bacterium]|nr:MarR family transcriptional regulator [Solirubrobacteraceae bacterium]